MSLLATYFVDSRVAMVFVVLTVTYWLIPVVPIDSYVRSRVVVTLSFLFMRILGRASMTIICLENSVMLCTANVHTQVTEFFVFMVIG
jgi:hypothetical protein